MARKWWVLAAVACGTFMATLDSSIVNVALPTLTRYFGSKVAETQWVVDIYLLTISCALLPLGRLSDIRGRKKMFLSGFLLFMLGSVLCGIAPALSLLVFFRLIQGLGAALLMANGPAIITSVFPQRERGTALGVMAMVVSLGLISGPSLGGILLSHSSIGWRSIFLVNIPVCLLGIFLVQIFIRARMPAAKEEDSGPTATEDLTRTLGPFDWKGTLWLINFQIALLLFVTPPSFHIPRWLFGGASLIFLNIFIWVELKSRSPLLDLTLLRNRTFWAANLSAFLIFVAYQCLAVLMPFFLEGTLDLKAEDAGRYLAVIPIFNLVIAPISGWVSDQIGHRMLTILGSGIMCFSLFLMSGVFGQLLRPSMSHFDLAIALALVGIGLGLFQSPNNSAIMSSVPRTKLGVASAFQASVRNLGFTIGAGISSGVFHWQQLETSNDLSSMRFTFLVACLFAFGSVLAAFAKPKERHL